MFNQAFQSRWGRALIIGGMVVLCLLLGQAIEHAYVAAWSAGTILVIGFVFPGLIIRLLSARVRESLMRCHAGDSVSLTLEQTNRWLLPIPAVAIDHANIHDLTLKTAEMTIKHGISTVQLQLRPVRRGVWDLSGFRFITSFPFGIWKASRTIEGRGNLIVWPNPVKVTTFDAARINRSFIAKAQESRLGTDGECCGAREYRRGDSIRSVHWQQTARYERLMVQGRIASVEQNRALWIDTRASSFTDSQLFERVLSVGACLIEQGLNQGLMTDLWIGSSLIRVENKRGYIEALDRMAGAKMTTERWPLDLMYQRGGLVITTWNGWKSLVSVGLIPFVVDSNDGGVYSL